MSTIFRPHPDGGLSGEITANGQVVPVIISWDNGAVKIDIDGPFGEERSARVLHVLGWLLAQIGSHAVEFSQALVPASPCLAHKEESAAAQRGNSPAPSEEGPAGAVTVAGVQIAPAAEKPKRRKASAATLVQGPPATTDAPAASVEPTPAALPQAPAASAVAPDPTEAFAAQMADATARQEALRSPAEPRFRQPEQAAPAAPVTGAQEPLPPPEEYRVEPEPDPIDKLVDLLAYPGMPPDLRPFEWLRSAADRRYADTAITRLMFLRCLEPEYQEAGAHPYRPALPPRDQMVVDVDSPSGVAAFVNLLFAIDQRAAVRGIEIPQLVAWLDLYRDANGVRTACEYAWNYIQRKRQESAQRLAAQQAQAQPVPNAPAYAAPQVHGAHPAYVPQQPAYAPQQAQGGHPAAYGAQPPRYPAR